MKPTFEQRTLNDLGIDSGQSPTPYRTNEHASDPSQEAAQTESETAPLTHLHELCKLVYSPKKVRQPQVPPHSEKVFDNAQSLFQSQSSAHRLNHAASATIVSNALSDVKHNTTSRATNWSAEKGRRTAILH